MLTSSVIYSHKLVDITDRLKAIKKVRIKLEGNTAPQVNTTLTQKQVDTVS